MKKQAFLFVLISVAIIILSLASCTEEPHVHTFSSEWTYDEAYHWHKSICGHDDVSGKAEHSWNSGVVTTEATHTTDGVRLLTCTVCGATKTEVIPALVDAHTYSDEWTTDETYHWHASTCGHDVVSGKEEHSWDSGQTAIVPTYTDTGIVTYTCTTCSATMTDIIPVLQNEFIGTWVMKGLYYDEEETGIHDVLYLCFSSNQFQAIFDMQISDFEKARTYVVDGLHDYLWGNNFDYSLSEEDINSMSIDDLRSIIIKADYWSSTLPAADRKPQQYSIDDNGTVTVNIIEEAAAEIKIKDDHLVLMDGETPLFFEKSQNNQSFVNALYNNLSVIGIEHDWDAGVRILDNSDLNYCAYVDLYRCRDCGAIKANIQRGILGGHTFSSEWISDDTYHWHASTCGHDVVSDKAEHSWNSGVVTTAATHTADGARVLTCIVCGATKRETIPALVDAHTYSEEWTNDETYHWHVSTCGHDVVSDKVDHSYVNHICSVCGYVDYTYLFSIDSYGQISLIEDVDVPSEINIPTTVNGIQVTGIQANAFKRCTEVARIIIPDCVTSIGSGAFYGCTNLTDITIPDSVTNIGESAFHNCRNLTSIIIPDSAHIGENAFSSCNSLTSITMPLMFTTLEALFGGSVPSSLKEVVFTSGDRIVQKAFYNCTSITNITIPNSVTKIGENAFYNCRNLTCITLPDFVTKIEYATFSDCIGLTSITIPNSVTSIGTSAFAGCTGLTNITIPDSVISIGYAAFAGCSNLTSIILPDSLSTIGDSAFDSCSSLKTVTIPDSVTRIGTAAFAGCSNLTSIILPDSVTDIGTSTFVKCISLATVIIPDSVETLGTGAFYDCSGLSNIVIPNSVETIGDHAFHGCSNLESISIPDSVETLGAGAFYDCSGLSNIVIPNSVETIGDYAFHGCSSLESISIPDSVTSIGDFAFAGCSSLISIMIPNSVTSIGDSAFSDCNSLASITIPESVTGINSKTFYNCSRLTSLSYEGDSEQWQSLSKGTQWNDGVPATVIHCSDGDVAI